MKYYVRVGAAEVEVVVDGDRVTVGGRTVPASLSPVPGTPIRQLLLDGRPLAPAVEPVGSGRWLLTLGGERWEAEVVDERTRHIRALAGAGAERRGVDALRAPMPGLVVRVAVAPGQAVAAGAAVAVLEAMKMENELRAPAAAVVRAVRVAPGQAVERGAVLVEFEPPGPP